MPGLGQIVGTGFAPEGDLSDPIQWYWWDMATSATPLHVCASDGRIKVDGRWTGMRCPNHHRRLGTSHGICPECAERLYGEVMRD